MLYEKGIYPSREKAKQAIESRRVKVDDKIIDKPSFLCDENCKVIALPFEFVSRGGYKLQKAIEEFKIDLSNRICLDIGASTGGFTDVCLKNGAKKVYSVDTGIGQLDKKLIDDPRVINLEKTNYLELDKLNYQDADFVCIDVSFVSLTKLAFKLSKDDLKEIVALIKPQFECGLEYAKKHKGIVKDSKIHKKVIENVANCFESFGYKNKGIIVSPIKGGDGNTEFLIHLQK